MFERTVKVVFGQVRTLSAPGSAPSNSPSDQNRLATAKRVGGAGRNLGRNVRVLFLYCHLVFLSGLALNPLWQVNALSSGECQVRLVWKLLAALSPSFLCSPMRPCCFGLCCHSRFDLAKTILVLSSMCDLFCMKRQPWSAF